MIWQKQRQFMVSGGVVLVMIIGCQLFSSDTAYLGIKPVEAGVVSVSGIDVAAPIPFPHPYVNGGMSGTGAPFVGIPGDANALNPDVLDAYAQYPFVFANVTPGTDIRPDILTAMRQRNPKQIIFGYLNGTDIWCPQDSDGNNSYPAGSFYRDMWTTVSGGASCTSTSDRFLWFQDGQRTDAIGTNINLSHFVVNPDSSIRYDVAEDEAQVIYNHVVAPRLLDGEFIDVFCPNILWMETLGNPGRTFNYARAGYASRAAFDAGWQAGFVRLTARLRELAGPDFPIIGNCGQAPATIHSYLNGWDREDYPIQNGGSLYTNLLSWPWGYLHQDHNFLQPSFNIIYTIADTVNGTIDPYTASNQRKMRYGLGSTSLGDGWFLYGDNDNGTLTSSGSHYQWWNDEDGVITNVPQSDPTYGHAAKGAQYGGWLGFPRSQAYNMLATNFGTVSDLLTTNQGLETAGANPTVIPGWTSTTGSGFSANTITRDTTTAGEGQASVRIDIMTGDPADGNQTMVATGDYSVVGAQTYTVSFKAKATTSVPIKVNLGFYGSQIVRADTSWRQYQAVITAPINENNAAVKFGFTLRTGTYWIDDVHVQLGQTGIWRRDFEKGIVLVNPTANALTVVLEKPFKKIVGTVNPSVNDGSLVSQVTIAGTGSGPTPGTGDALFLLDVDTTAPAMIDNLSTP